MRVAIPFDSFTIEDIDGAPVEFDNYRPTMLVNANKEEARIQNHVLLKVKFGDELVRVFKVNKQKTSEPHNKALNLVDTTFAS